MTHPQPPAAILALGTATPPHQAQQAAVGRWMAASFGDRPALGRWLRQLYARSGIETRYACVPDFCHPPERSRLAPGRDQADWLTTAERMAIYQRESVKLGVAAGRQALDAYRARDPAAPITHLVVVSCTGFFAPGLDIALAQALGLPPTVQRTLIGFMGCAAAFNGLRTAAQIVQGQPTARVLVVCVELCSIHIQPGTRRENLISAALFADGASAGVVGPAGPGQSDLFELIGFHTRLEPETGGEMVWQIGNHGFTLNLSPQIPEHLAQAAPAALRALLGDSARPGFWAIHPGGKAIIDRLAEIFELAPAQVQASRAVLRRFGNLSSATIFFVLAELRRSLSRTVSPGQPPEGVAMAFGPGLVIEMAHLRYRPPAAPASLQNGAAELKPERDRVVLP